MQLKTKFTHFFGSIIAFLFSYNSTLAQNAEVARDYGIVLVKSEPTLWEKILNILLTPLALIITAVLVFVIGLIIYLKKRKNHAIKDSKKDL